MPTCLFRVSLPPTFPTTSELRRWLPGKSAPPGGPLHTSRACTLVHLAQQSAHCSRRQTMEKRVEYILNCASTALGVRTSAANSTSREIADFLEVPTVRVLQAWANGDGLQFATTASLSRDAAAVVFTKRASGPVTAENVASVVLMSKVSSPLETLQLAITELYGPVLLQSGQVRPRRTPELGSCTRTAPHLPRPPRPSAALRAPPAHPTRTAPHPCPPPPHQPALPTAARRQDLWPPRAARGGPRRRRPARRPGHGLGRGGRGASSP